MKEYEFINIIKKLTNNSYIGDDCAYLKDFDLVITQDSLVENIHFKSEWATPFQLGYKSVIVNISDILASGAEPKFITIALSLPSEINSNFIEEFYNGAVSALNGAEIVGGDITGAEKIMISVTALGCTKNRKISSRKNAKSGYVIISTGEYGLSSAGLNELRSGGDNQNLIRAHLEPQLNPIFSRAISTQITEDYAMMDTSDGLADALFKIAEASEVTINSKYIDGMFESEDYNLVAAVPQHFLKNLKDYYILGEVTDYKGYYLNIEGEKYSDYNELNLFDHFGGNHE